MSGKICPQPVWGPSNLSQLEQERKSECTWEISGFSKKCLANFSSNTVTLARNPPKPLNRYFGPCGNLRLPSLMNSGWHGKPWDMTSWAPWKLHATPPLASPSRKLPWLMTPFSSVQQITSLVFWKAAIFMQIRMPHLPIGGCHPRIAAVEDRHPVFEVVVYRGDCEWNSKSTSAEPRHESPAAQRNLTGSDSMICQQQGISWNARCHFQNSQCQIPRSWEHCKMTVSTYGEHLRCAEHVTSQDVLGFGWSLKWVYMFLSDKRLKERRRTCQCPEVGHDPSASSPQDPYDRMHRPAKNVKIWHWSTTLNVVRTKEQGSQTHALRAFWKVYQHC